MRRSTYMLRRPLILGAVLFACSGIAAAQPEISRGAIIASTCFTCHGTDGHAVGTMPSLNGLPAQYIEVVMRDFKARSRVATVMDRHASGYTDEEIVELANYIGQLK